MRSTASGRFVVAFSLLVGLVWCGPAAFAQTAAAPVEGLRPAVTTFRPLFIPRPGLTLLGDSAQVAPQSTPRTAGQEPSLGDLGITPEQAKGNTAEQARLDKRSHMLKIHQRLGLITIAPLVATLIAAGSAGEKHTGGSGRAMHAALGSATVGMYLTTASFAIFAPKVPQTNVRGGIRWHRRLAYVHGVGMILIPILGAMAYHQIENGQKVHGIASIHGPVAVVTTSAFAAAVLSVSLKF